MSYPAKKASNPEIQFHATKLNVNLTKVIEASLLFSKYWSTYTKFHKIGKSEWAQHYRDGRGGKGEPGEGGTNKTLLVPPKDYPNTSCTTPCKFNFHLQIWSFINSLQN